MKQLGLALEAPQQPRTGALRSFHIQSHVSVAEALEGERRAAGQEADVLCFFQTNPGRWMPSQVHREFPGWPITSVRRALTNLTAAGKLIHHTSDRRMGPHGSKESVWSLA